MARITHPQPLAGTQTFIGVTFHDGFAEVDLAELSPHTVEALVLHGYVIDDTIAEAPAKAPTAAEKRDAKKAAEAAALQARFDDGDEFLADYRARGVEVGSILRLTRRGRELLGGDDDTIAEVIDLHEEAAGHAGPAASVTWSDGTETIISLSLVELVPDEPATQD